MSEQNSMEMNHAAEAEEYQAFMKELNNLGIEMLDSLNRIDHLIQNISAELRTAHTEITAARTESCMAMRMETPSA